MYTFPNGKKYIGKTNRTLQHRQGYKWRGYETCKLLWKAIQKYGTENIKTDILFEGVLSNDEASEMERFYIAKYKTNANRYKNPQYGYNLTDGGEGLVGWHPSPERLEQMMQQLVKAKEVRLKMGFSEESRRKMSESHKGLRCGYKMPEETKAKIGRSNSLENMSPEERQRRSDSKKQKVMVTNPKDGEQMIFNSIHETAEHFGVRDSAVSRWIDGTRRPSNKLRFEKYSPTTTE